MSRSLEDIREELRMLRRGLDTDILQFLAESVSAIVVDLETQEIIYATCKADEMFGYMRRELMEKRLDDLIPEHLQKLHADHVSRYRENPVPRIMGLTRIEVLGQRRDKSKITLEVSLHPGMLFGRRCALAIMQRAPASQTR